MKQLGVIVLLSLATSSLSATITIVSKTVLAGSSSGFYGTGTGTATGWNGSTYTPWRTTDGWNFYSGADALASAARTTFMPPNIPPAWVSGFAESWNETFWEVKVKWNPSSPSDVPAYGHTYPVLMNQYYKHFGWYRATIPYADFGVTPPWYFFVQGSAGGSPSFADGDMVELVNPDVYEEKFNKSHASLTSSADVLNTSGTWTLQFGNLNDAGVVFSAPDANGNIYGYFTVSHSIYAFTEAYGSGANLLAGFVYANGVASHAARYEVVSVAGINVP